MVKHRASTQVMAKLMHLVLLVCGLGSLVNCSSGRGATSAFTSSSHFHLPSPISNASHGTRVGLRARVGTSRCLPGLGCAAMTLPTDGPITMMKRLSAWRAARRATGISGEGTGGVGGVTLDTHSGGSGPPRSGGLRRWGGGGGGDDGGEGGYGGGRISDLGALGAAQALMSTRRTRYGSSYGGGGRRSYGRQTTRRRRRASDGTITMTKVITAINVLVYIMQMRYPSITKAGWKLASAMVQRGQWYRLLTPVALHGSVSHLLINSLSLSSVGPVVEQVMGKTKFLTVYMLAGISGNALSCFINPRTPAVGASGAIFGMVGAWGAFCLMNQAVLGKEQSQRSLRGVGQTLMINFIYGMSSTHIDNMGHLGGFLGGALATFLIGPRLRRRLNPLTGQTYTVDVSSRLSLPRFGPKRDPPVERRWP